MRAAPGSCDMVGLSCDMQTGTSLFPLDYAMPPRLADVQTLAHTETTWGNIWAKFSRAGILLIAWINVVTYFWSYSGLIETLDVPKLWISSLVSVFITLICTVLFQNTPHLSWGRRIDLSMYFLG